VIAALLAAGGATATGWAVAAATSRRRPLDIVAALVAPAGVIAFVVGAVAWFVPDLLR